MVFRGTISYGIVSERNANSRRRALRNFRKSFEIQRLSLNIRHQNGERVPS